MAKNLKNIRTVLIISLTIILFVGMISYYTLTINSKDSQIQTLTNQKNQLQIWLDENTTLLKLTETWLNGNVTKLTNLLNQFKDTVVLKKVGILFNNYTITLPPHMGFGVCIDYDSAAFTPMKYSEFVIESSSLVTIEIQTEVAYVKFSVNGTKTMIIPGLPSEITIWNPDPSNSVSVTFSVISLKIEILNRLQR